MSEIFDYDCGSVYAFWLCIIVFPRTALKVKKYVCDWTGISPLQLMRTACNSWNLAVAEQQLLLFLKMHFSHP